MHMHVTLCSNERIMQKDVGEYPCHEWCVVYMYVDKQESKKPQGDHSNGI